MNFVGKGVKDSVEELLDYFHEAARISDSAAYFACFNSPESRFLGTDAKEIGQCASSTTSPRHTLIRQKVRARRPGNTRR